MCRVAGVSTPQPHPGETATAVPPADGRQGTQPLFPAPAAEPGTGLAAASGAGNLVGRHEARVPKSPECHSAIRPDHQVGDAAIVEGETEPAFRRELQRPAGGRGQCDHGGSDSPSPKASGRFVGLGLTSGRGSSPPPCLPSTGFVRATPAQ